VRPEKKPTQRRGPVERLKSSEDLAAARFGAFDGLAVVEKTTMELAHHYSDKFALDPNDPDVAVITAALAFARHKEFMLLRQIEKDLHNKVLSTDMDYGEILFRTATTGTHNFVHKELDRLHARCDMYLTQLRLMSAEVELRAEEPRP